MHSVQLPLHQGLIFWAEPCYIHLTISTCWWDGRFSFKEIRQPVRIDDDFSIIHRQHSNSEYKVHPLVRALRCFKLEPRKPICLVLADLSGR